MKTSLATAAFVVALLGAVLACPVEAQNQLILLNKKKLTDNKLKVAGGQISFDVKNIMNIKADDIHVKITSPVGATITNFIAGKPFTNAWGANKEGGADGGEVHPDSQVMIHVELAGVANGATVVFEVNWSRNGRDVTMFSAAGIGAEGPDTALLSAVVPDYNAQPVSVTLGTDELTCNDIAIGETFQYRFEQGSLIVKPSNGRFKLQPDTVVKGFNEDGGDVTGTAAFSVANIRINDFGYLVFEVSRDRTDEQHVAIVIRGIKLVGLAAASEPHEVHVGMSGAAISGVCEVKLIHIATVQEEG